MAFVTPIDYPEEVLMWMKVKEKRQHRYEGNSPQITLRGAVVDFVRHVCEKLKQSVLTTHLAVCLLDYFMDCHDISDHQLRLAGLAVVLLAAKFEERDNNIPRVSDLNAFADKRYTSSIFSRMETFMLNFFEWNIGFVTAAHFAEIFLMYSVTPEDWEYRQNAPSCLPFIQRELWYSTQHYLDVSLQDLEFLKWKCSEVAAACIACGRIHSSLIPAWPPSLEVATGHTLENLEELIALLHSLSVSEESTRRCRTPDSGYQTCSPPFSDSQSTSYSSSPASCDLET